MNMTSNGAFGQPALLKMMVVIRHRPLTDSVNSGDLVNILDALFGFNLYHYQNMVVCGFHIFGRCIQAPGSMSKWASKASLPNGRKSAVHCNLFRFLSG